MKITDLEGHLIEVTDLGKAIRQAKLFKGYRHQDNKFSEFDKRKKAYWTDLYNKLIQLHMQLKNTSK